MDLTSQIESECTFVGCCVFADLVLDFFCVHFRVGLDVRNRMQVHGSLLAFLVDFAKNIAPYLPLVFVAPGVLSFRGHPCHR